MPRNEPLKVKFEGENNLVSVVGEPINKIVMKIQGARIIVFSHFSSNAFHFK